MQGHTRQETALCTWLEILIQSQHAQKNPMIIKTSLTASKILEGFQIWDSFFKEQQTPHKQPTASRYQQTALMMMMMQEREQEGRSAGVNYLMVGWSRARSKLVGEGGEVQQGDLKQWWQSGEKKEHKRDTEIRWAMKADAWKIQYKTTEQQSFKDTWHVMQRSDPGQSALANNSLHKIHWVNYIRTM